MFIIHHQHKLSVKRYISVAVLFLTALSFSLPKEVFDPHIGIDYDIFCQLSSYINSDFQDLDLCEILETEEVCEKITELKNIYRMHAVLSNLLIRGPPLITACN